MEIRSSALKHGVDAEDVLHALQVPMVQLDGEDGRTLVLGADRAGRLLEIVVMDRDTDTARVIHAMAMRPKFRRYLR